MPNVPETSNDWPNPEGYCHCCGAPKVNNTYQHDRECIYFQDSEKPFKAHCGASGPDTQRGISTICMRDEGHDGEHEWSTFEIGNGYVAIVPTKP